MTSEVQDIALATLEGQRTLISPTPTLTRMSDNVSIEAMNINAHFYRAAQSFLGMCIRF